MQGAEEEFPRFCRGCRAASHRIPGIFRVWRWMLKQCFPQAMTWLCCRHNPGCSLVPWLFMAVLSLSLDSVQSWNGA
jgi:hypothetical protein